MSLSCVRRPRISTTAKPTQRNAVRRFWGKRAVLLALPLVREWSGRPPILIARMPQGRNNSDGGVDESAHDDAIDSLVAETGMAPEHVRDTYKRILAQLEDEAHVKEFLKLFAIRRTREALKSTAQRPRIGRPRSI